MVYMNKSIAELLDNGTYNGYEYAIVSRGLYPCAYVKLPEGHKYYGKDYNDIPIKCHCGLSYSKWTLDVIYKSKGWWFPKSDGCWWIGWNYGHICDYSGDMLEYVQDIHMSYYKKWTTQEILDEVMQVIDNIIEDSRRLM